MSISGVMALLSLPVLVVLCLSIAVVVVVVAAHIDTKCSLLLLFFLRHTTTADWVCSTSVGCLVLWSRAGGGVWRRKG